MKKFFGRLLTSILGTLLALVLIVFILAASIIGSQEKKIASNSILKLNFSTPLPEHSDNVNFNKFSGNVSSGPGLFKTIELIEKAKNDARIQGIFLDLSHIGLSQTKITNLLEALDDFNDSGKPIYAFSNHYSQHAYLLASAADSIFLDPNGSLELKGYSYASPFYKQLMEKLGVEYKIYYAGDYKGATEPFRRTDLSEKNAYQWKVYLESLHSKLVEKISQKRGVSEQIVEQQIDRGEHFNGNSALSAGLIDGLWYRHDLEQHLKDKFDTKDLKFIDLKTFGAQVKDKKNDAKSKIAVVFAEGEIVSSGAPYGSITQKNYSKIFSEIENNEDVKAMVLRINSPGGDGQVSDALANQIKRIRNKGIPVVTSMGSMAASGGYYLAALSDKICAEENTLTGSIGVFVMLPQVQKFMDEYAEVFFDTLKTSEFATGYSPFYNLSPAQEKMFQDLTDDMYDKFLHVVAEGRNMSVENVDSVAQGRIWTAEDAMKIGLVDEITGLKGAIDIAVELANLDKFQLQEFPNIEKPVWEEMLMDIMDPKSTKVDLLIESASDWNRVKKELKALQHVAPITRMPFIEIN